MDKNENKFIELLDSPEELERLYRTKPVKFQEWFNDAAIKFPDSEIIRVWGVRLNYSISASENIRKSNLIYIVVLSVLSGLLVKLPEFIKIAED